MDEKKNDFISQTYFSIADILFSILHGAPFFWRKDIPWRSIRVPPFPIFLSIVSGILSYLPAFVSAYSPVSPPGLASQVVTLLFSSVMGALFIVFLNLITLFWIRYVIRYFSHTQNPDSKEYIFGAQRVLYFSAFYQLLLFIVCMALAFNYDPKYMSITTIVMVLTSVVRLLSVFQCVIREIGGYKTAALISILPCYDVWFMYMMMLG